MVKAPPSPPSFPQTAGPPGAVVSGGGHPGLDISEVHDQAFPLELPWDTASRFLLEKWLLAGSDGFYDPVRGVLRVSFLFLG